MNILALFFITFVFGQVEDECDERDPQSSPIPTPTFTSVTITSSPFPTQTNSLEQDCLDAINSRRALTGASNVQWDLTLQGRSGNAAAHCANVFEHFDTNNVAQIIATPSTCAESIVLWYDNEIASNGGHYRIIKDPSYTIIGCTHYYGNNGYGGCVACDFN